jgi:serine/threonine-protein kinase
MSAANEEQQAEILDAYVERLHAGRPEEAARLRQEHPQLATAMDCLEDLERLASDAVGKSALLTGASDGPTIGLPPPPVTFTPPPPTFGRYELRGEIGRGGMGVVYKAWQGDLERWVALKMILPGHLGSVEQIARFQVEARAAARLQHPNIISVYEVGELHGQHYFAMQYISGNSLAHVVREKNRDPEKAASLMARVARAVAHLHASNIVHRDLKPSNILLDEAGNPYVTDFGLVKVLQSDSEVTATGAVLGTPSYMAPEQAGGRTKEVGPKSDVYSLGAILYELLTGRPPFREATPLDTLIQVLEAEPTPPRRLNPDVPFPLELICLRCLEKDPGDRYASATALAEDLDRYLQGEDVEARALGVVERVRRWSRREPALASRLGVLAAVIGILQITHHFARALELGVHLQVVGFLGAWGALSFLFQRLLSRRRWADLVPFAWCATDMILITVILKITDDQLTPIVVAYPLLVVGSGLWFRVPLVVFATVVAELAYAALIIDYALITPGGLPRVRHHILFMVMLGVCGAVVSYQVRRVRALSKYYEHRPL